MSVAAWAFAGTLVNAVALALVGWWARGTKKAVTPNGGQSVADAVTRIEQKVDVVVERVDGVVERTDELADNQTRQGRRIEAAHRRLDRMGRHDGE